MNEQQPGQHTAMIEFFKDLFLFSKKRKKLWMIPLLFAMALVGLLILFTEASAISPFIYALF